MSNYIPHQPHPWVRRLYALCLYVLLPIVPLYLLWRGRKQPEYRQHWAERFSCYRQPRIAPQKRRIWLHAVSLGETRATAPLVHAFFAQNTDAHIILTHTTPTGRASGQELFAPYLQDGRMTQVYAPYDLNPLLNRFFKTFAPTDVWIMETEVWPNLMAQCVQRNIPASLINGRMSEKTLKQTLQWQKLMGSAYAGFTHVCAQTETDAQRYREIGVVDAQLTVTGNLKFDMQIPPEQVAAGERIKNLLTDTRVIMLASSREGEEQLWLDAIAEFERTDPQMAQSQQRIQWWIVPRHPQRFDEVMTLLKNTGKNVVRKSELNTQPTAQQISALAQADMVLGDTMGEMFTYYAIADIVLMGGTWLPYGGQNFIEPMSLGKVVWVGASIYNFEQIGVDAIDNGVLWQAQSLVEALAQTEQTEQHNNSMHTRIRTYINERYGAVKKLREKLET
ncbi:MAG: waaA [Burkholderiaceae bacterium]|nr:waaA [Burkholderiaceae bacterium]